LRFLKRFGLAGKKAGTVKAYNAVMAAANGFDADDLFELHWLLKFLAKKFCTHNHPCCMKCPLSDTCLKRTDENILMN
jgi:endonuclease III